jgi:hypothetical protein
MTVGHPNINTTADAYAHISQETERETARVVERVIYGDLVPWVRPAPDSRSVRPATRLTEALPNRALPEG